MNFKMTQLTSGLHVAKCCSYKPNEHENWAEHGSNYSPGCIWCYLILLSVVNSTSIKNYLAWYYSLG
jgi:hypothetical protein